MRLRAPHVIGIALIAVGIVAVLLVQVFGWAKPGGIGRPLTVVDGVVGSEKQAFFEDPQVQEAFAEHGYDVRVTTSGSFRMAELPGLNEHDFAFPASTIAAQNIGDNVEGVTGVHELFFTPMAVATFEPIMQVLEANGVASQDETGKWSIDMAAYLELAASDERWRDLEGSEAYASPRSVLMTSTDIRSSNSAAMYLALAAFVLADESVVTSQAQAQELLPELSRLFVAQGNSGTSSAAPFADYLSLGSGAVPMVMVYEGQFVEELAKPASRITDDMVLAYPSPTMFSTHTAVTFSDDGEQIAQLLETDPRLAELLAEHGFRSTGAGAQAFDDFVAERGVADRFARTSDFVSVAQEPTYEVLEFMLQEIGREYEIGGAPPAAEDGDAATAEETAS